MSSASDAHAGKLARTRAAVTAPSRPVEIEPAAVVAPSPPPPTTTVVVVDSTPAPAGPRPISVASPVPEFARFPYADGHRGFVRRDGKDRGRLVSGRAALEGSYLGDHVWRGALDVELALWRVSLRNELGAYVEAPSRDTLVLGNTSLYFAAVLRPRVIWRLGLGANYFIDGKRQGERPPEHRAGLGLSTTLDVFPIKPLVLSARADIGGLGGVVTMMGRASIGVALRRFEIYAAAEYRDIGGVRFAGPGLGVRAWF
ncbi:MAG: hypothetical protein K1X88_36040 [Nannocystaceae bacterium]|nr:hypothetical protein [Nannocystaceae bacterium]